MPSASLVCVLCFQRYGLWDHEGPLKEDPAPEHCEDERKNVEGEDVGQAEKSEEKDTEEKEGRVSSRTDLEKLENAEQVSTNDQY